MITHKYVNNTLVVCNDAPELSPRAGKLYLIVDNTNPNFKCTIDPMAQFLDEMNEFSLEAERIAE
jgi:hypothetical protein